VPTTDQARTRRGSWSLRGSMKTSGPRLTDQAESGIQPPDDMIHTTITKAQQGVQPRYGQKPPSAVLNGGFRCSGGHGLSVLGFDRNPNHEIRHLIRVAETHSKSTGGGFCPYLGYTPHPLHQEAEGITWADRLRTGGSPPPFVFGLQGWPFKSLDWLSSAGDGPGRCRRTNCCARGRGELRAGGRSGVAPQD